MRQKYYHHHYYHHYYFCDEPRQQRSDPMMERPAYDYLFNYKPAYKQLFGRNRYLIFFVRGYDLKPTVISGCPAKHED